MFLQKYIYLHLKKKKTTVWVCIYIYVKLFLCIFFLLILFSHYFIINITTSSRSTMIKEKNTLEPCQEPQQLYELLFLAKNQLAILEYICSFYSYYNKYNYNNNRAHFYSSFPQNQSCSALHTTHTGPQVYTFLEQASNTPSYTNTLKYFKIDAHTCM